jgi:hypothetical protein
MAYEEGTYTAEALADHKVGRHAEKTVDHCPPCEEIEIRLGDDHLEGRHETGEEPLCWICCLPETDMSIQRSLTGIRDSEEREAWDVRHLAEKEERQKGV